MNHTEESRLIRLPEVQHLTGLSKSLIYSLIKQNKFPKQVELNARTAAWIYSEVLDWCERKIELSRNGGNQ